MRLSCSIIGCLLVCWSSAYAEPAPVEAKAPTKPVADSADGGVGVIHIETDVEGLSILVDGVIVGKTPLPGPWALSTGKHRIELKPPEGASVFHDVNIESKRTTVVPYTLDAAPAGKTAKSGEQGTRFVVPPINIRSAGLATAGAGLAMLVAGIVYGIQAQSNAEQASGLDRRTQTRVRFDGLIEETNTAAAMSNVLVGFGLAAILGGTSMNLFLGDGPLASSSSPKADVVVEPSAAVGELPR